MRKNDKKRALYIGFNRKYVNRYLELSINVFGSIFDLDFYGPGYNSEKVINTGLEKWLRNQDNYDIVFLDPLIPYCDKSWTKDKFDNSFKMNQIYFSYDQFYNHIESYRSFFKNTNILKVAICIYDYYVIENSVIDYLKSSKCFVIDVFGKNLHKPIDELKNIYGESVFYERKILNNWYDFEQENSEKIISFPHAVYLSELHYAPIDKREYEFNVVGVLYPERKEALKVLNFRQKCKILFENIIAFLNIKLGLNQVNQSKINVYFEKYNHLIQNSKLVYCSGSPLLYAVRKFFEIPSKATVAIGWPCVGFEHLGFKHDVNFIVAKSNSEIEHVLNTYPTERLQSIADEGFKLIRDYHSISARTHQMQQVFDLILDGKFCGSYWENGKYVCNTC